MVCRNCHAQIADKAIVCYKCGTATALPAAPARAPVAAGGAGWVAALILAVVAAAVWIWRPGPYTDAVRVAAAVVFLASLVLAARLRLRRRR